MTARTCSRCGGTDNPSQLPRRFACKTCGDRLLCYACDVSHNLWCESRAFARFTVPTPPAVINALCERCTSDPITDLDSGLCDACSAHNDSRVVL